MRVELKSSIILSFASDRKEMRCWLTTAEISDSYPFCSTPGGGGVDRYVHSRANNLSCSQRSATAIVMVLASTPSVVCLYLPRVEYIEIRRFRRNGLFHVLSILFSYLRIFVLPKFVNFYNFYLMYIPSLL